MSRQTIDLEALARAVRGAVIRPTDAAYDDTRRTFNAMLDHRPVVIVSRSMWRMCQRPSAGRSIPTCRSPFAVGGTASPATGSGTGR